MWLGLLNGAYGDSGGALSKRMAADAVSTPLEWISRTGEQMAYRASRFGVVAAMLLAATAGLTSCGSYTMISHDDPPSEATFVVGQRYRVTTVGGDQITDRVVRVNAYSVVFRDSAFWLRDIRSVERLEVPDMRFLALGLGALAYVALVLAMG
jgi:hypothetical protein